MKNWVIGLLTAVASASTWAAVRSIVIDYLKSTFVKAILLKFFGNFISGGYKAFIAKLIVEYAFDELALPIVKLAFRKMGYAYHRAEGQIIFKRIQEAKVTHDQEKYDRAVDDLFK